MSSYKSVRFCTKGNESVLMGERTHWALEMLKLELQKRSIGLSYAGKADIIVILTGPEGAADLAQSAGSTMMVANKTESLAIFRADKLGQKRLVLAGYDDSGLMYALLEVYDCVVNADDPIEAIEHIQEVSETPLNAVRSMKRIFCSEIEDKPWFYDHEFWNEYLTGLAISRINRMNLTLGMGMDHSHDPNLRDNYFCFSYPFFVQTPEYPEVHVRYLSRKEQKQNLNMLRYIALQCRKRGIQFQLALWTHAYKLVGCDNENYPIVGLNDENHADYCRHAMRTLLDACPGIDGITLRVHYECGIPEPAHEFWRIVLKGVIECGRVVELDIHAKGTDAAMLKVCTDTGMPVLVNCKYHAEHFGLPYQQTQIRPTEMPGIPGNYDKDKLLSYSLRRHVRYGYADYLREDRNYSVIHRVFPGTQRLLLWADPVFAAAHSRNGIFCGSKGIEFMEPLTYKARKDSGFPSGRDPYENPYLRFKPNGEWMKYAYFYRIWGRLLYNPQAKPDVWLRYLRSNFGDAADACGQAIGYASRLLPIVSMAHLPSAAHAQLWMEMYTNMSIVEESHPSLYGDTPQPRIFSTVSPLDPEMFYRICDYVKDLLSGELSGKYSPLQVSDWLLMLANKAEASLIEAEKRIGSVSAEYERFVLDVHIQIGIGRFFAHKFRSAVSYELFTLTQCVKHLETALEEYHAARKAWAVMAQVAADEYCVDLNFGHIEKQRGHWLDRLPQIDEDIKRMTELLQKQEKMTEPITPIKLIEYRAPLSSPNISHQPPESFIPGHDMQVRLDVFMDKQVRLHYRHVSQGELYVVRDMHPLQSNQLIATIPSEYTNSPFPIMYWFEIRNSDGTAFFFPGLGNHLDCQPYYVVRSNQPSTL